MVSSIVTNGSTRSCSRTDCTARHRRRSKLVALLNNFFIILEVLNKKKIEEGGGKEEEGMEGKERKWKYIGLGFFYNGCKIYFK